MKIWIFDVFLEMIPDQSWTVPRLKKHNFNAEYSDFSIKWCEALSFTFLSAAPSADFDVPALVHDFDPLALYFW